MKREEMEAELNRLKALPDAERELAVSESLVELHDGMIDAAQAAHKITVITECPEISCFAMILGFMHRALHDDPFKRNAALEEMASRAAVSLGIRPAVVGETPAPPSEIVH